MIKISACAIVKNEEKNICKWVESVMSFADEIIIVDTGSQDKTKDMAKNTVAKVYDFAWINDFSAAKNFAIEKANGDWLVFLDGDEFFDTESQAKVRKIITNYHEKKEIIGFIIPCNNIDTDNNNLLISQDWRLRIFRNEISLRYKGKIHESLQDDSADKKDRKFMIMRKLQIIHTGYSSEAIQAKLKRNLKILLQEIREQGGEQPRHYYYLLDCYAGLGEYEKAIFYGRLALKYRQESGLLGNINSLLCRLLNSIRISGLGDYGCELEKAIQEFPDLPEVKFLYGQYLLANMKGMEARRALKDALRLYAKPTNDTDKLYNHTFSDMVPTAEEYLNKIKKYEPYYYAMQNKNYYRAAALASVYLQKGYKLYPTHAIRIGHLFR